MAEPVRGITGYREEVQVPSSAILSSVRNEEELAKETKRVQAVI